MVLGILIVGIKRYTPLFFMNFLGNKFISIVIWYANIDKWINN